MMPDVLPLRSVDSMDTAPLLVDAQQLAQLLSLGLRTIRAMDAAGKLPAPIRLSPGCVRWRTADVREWVQAGCPERSEWDSRQK